MLPDFMQRMAMALGVWVGGALTGIGIHGSAHSLSFRATEFSTVRLAGDSILRGGLTPIRSSEAATDSEATVMATGLSCTTSPRTLATGVATRRISVARVIATAFIMDRAPAAATFILEEWSADRVVSVRSVEASTEAAAFMEEASTVAVEALAVVASDTEVVAEVVAAGRVRSDT